ncbi:hypothetical protein QE152_g31288 [Popillia japonica]|uniref:Uncharacterized protein n=1 Tax=Popillia japonica TaxID=7064 RepID=A0AAW1JB24_POPJA
MGTRLSFGRHKEDDAAGIRSYSSEANSRNAKGEMGYRNMKRTFRGYSTVNHTTNFVEPAREQDPHWVPVGRFNEACLDRRMRGPPRANGQVPFRNLTRHVWTEE